MSTDLLYPKGFIFLDGDEPAYKATRDIYKGERVEAEMFEAVGGREPPKTGDPIQPWMGQYIWPSS